MNYELSFQKKSGKNAYKCKYCTTTNMGRNEIKDHFASVHERKKNHFCEICQKAFGYLRNKTMHQKSGICAGKPKKKPMKEVIEDIKNIQPVVEMNSIKIPKKVSASADNLCNLDYNFVFL